MYMKNKSLYLVESYLWGYEIALLANNINETYPYRKFSNKDFTNWLADKTNWSMVQGWAHAINENSENDYRSFESFFSFINEYKSS